MYMSGYIDIYVCVHAYLVLQTLIFGMVKLGLRMTLGRSD